MTPVGPPTLARHHRIALSVAAVVAILLIPATLPLVSARAAGSSARWLTTWGASTTVVDRGDPYVPAALVGGQANDQSIRSIVIVTSPGDHVRLRFSNQFGQRPIEFGP